MTADDFTTASIALLRSAVGWQSAIAKRLAIEPRTVERWLKARKTPEWVDAKLAELMGGISASPWPRDEWMIGDGVTADGRVREYIVHLMPPRFVARIVAMEDDAPEDCDLPADIVSGVVYQANPETMLCEIEWFDQVDPGAVTHLLEAAANAIEAQADTDDNRYGR